MCSQKSNTRGNRKLPISTLYLVLVGNRERRGPVSLRLVEPQASVALDLKDKRTAEWPAVVTKPPGQATCQDSKQEVVQKEGCVSYLFQLLWCSVWPDSIKEEGFFCSVTEGLVHHIREGVTEYFPSLKRMQKEGPYRIGPCQGLTTTDPGLQTDTVSS